MSRLQKDWLSQRRSISWEDRIVTPLRSVAVICFALAIVGRLAGRYFSFDLAVAVTPGVHRTILLPEVFFWGFLALGVILVVASWFRWPG